MKGKLEEYREHFHLQKALFSKIDHREAMVALVYKVTLDNEKGYILKISDRKLDYLREVYFLNYFKDLLPVPKIIAHIPPNDRLDGAILMEYLPGTLLQIEDVKDDLVYEVGGFLAKIHLNRQLGYGDLILERLDPDPKVPFVLKFQEGLDECKDHLPKTLIKNAECYFEKHLFLIESVDGPSIIHRDFRPGNLLINQGKLAGIIDWAGARSGFVEEDLFSLEHGEWAKNRMIQKPFLEGYASIRPLPNYTLLLPLLRLNKAIASIGFTVKKGTWNNKDAIFYQYNRQFLETFFR